MAARAPIWLRHDASLAHDIPGHPERPDRIRALEAAMEARDWLGFRRVEAPEASRSLLLAVHAEEHLRFIEELCAAGGGMIDGDTFAVSSTWEAALHAAGGAAAMVDELLAGDAPFGVAALRPPGHHADRARAMGFCFLNSIAVAARRAIDAHGGTRVLIFDWDVHHGNGTNDIFHADPRVLFVSIHQSPIYLRTGPATDVGSGPGEGYTVNLPVPPGSDDATYGSLTEHVVVPLIRAYEPQLVLVSAGFDAHHLEPLASCRVTEAGYASMTASLRRACEAVGAPLGLVLEGGYSLEALADSMVALVQVLGAEMALRQSDDVQVHRLAVEAGQRLTHWWPTLVR